MTILSGWILFIKRVEYILGETGTGFFIEVEYGLYACISQFDHFIFKTGNGRNRKLTVQLFQLFDHLHVRDVA